MRIIFEVHQKWKRKKEEEQDVQKRRTDLLEEGDELILGAEGQERDLDGRDDRGELEPLFGFGGGEGERAHDD